MMVTKASDDSAKNETESFVFGGIDLCATLPCDGGWLKEARKVSDATKAIFFLEASPELLGSAVSGSRVWVPDRQEYVSKVGLRVFP
jgi:hypothetical protein